jgi:isoleucyl-tRNA synthetase
VERVSSAYDDYAFHTVYHEVQNFCAVDLSAIYFSIVKDRLYVEGTNSLSRRSAQAVLYQTLKVLLVLLAPILPFTTEEAYQLLSVKSHPTLQLEDWPVLERFPRDEQATQRWDLLFQIRSDVLRAIEEAKGEGRIRDPLESCVSISCNGSSYDALAFLGEGLNSFFVVSQVCLERGGAEAPLTIHVSPAEGEKCQRCWLVSPTVGLGSDHSDICARCRSVLRAAG